MRGCFRPQEQEVVINAMQSRNRPILDDWPAPAWQPLFALAKTCASIQRGIVGNKANIAQHDTGSNKDFLK